MQFSPQLLVDFVAGLSVRVVVVDDVTVDLESGVSELLLLVLLLVAEFIDGCSGSGPSQVSPQSVTIISFTVDSPVLFDDDLAQALDEVRLGLGGPTTPKFLEGQLLRSHLVVCCDRG